MRSARQRFALFGGLTAAVLFAAWRVYTHRSRDRVVSHEGLDDPEVAQAFNQVASMPQMEFLRWFVARRAVAMVQAGQAADLGSGPGHLAIRLARAAPDLEVTGIDLSEEMLAEAERSAKSSGLQNRVAFKKGDAAQIPFPAGSLDLVVSTLSLHHWSDPVGVLNEIARVLHPPEPVERGPEPAQGRPGGAFLIFDLRRDMSAPFYLLLWFVTHWFVPRALRRVNEPLGSRDAAFTIQEAAHLAAQSRLSGWRVTHGPLWLTIEGVMTEEE